MTRGRIVDHLGLVSILMGGTADPKEAGGKEGVGLEDWGGTDEHSDVRLFVGLNRQKSFSLCSIGHCSLRVR